MFKFPFNRGKKEDDAPKDEPKEKPVRKRKKKEPEKPWGKIERIIVFFFLLTAPVLSLVFLMHSKDSKSEHPFSKVLSDTSFNAPKDIDNLKTKLLNEINQQGGTYGIWISSLNNSFSLGINENEKFEGASLFKIPLMISYFKEVEKGNINPNTNYTLKYSDQAGGAGILATLSPGTVVTYHDIVEAMGKNSDNSAFQIMANILGTGKEQEVISEIGMPDTNFNNGLTTPKDIGQLFYKLTNSNIISDSSKKELINSLENTDFENLIPAGVPQNIKVAHKYAGIENNLNDAGIVYTTHPYIIVVLTKDMKSIEAKTQIPKISKIVYDWQSL